MEDGKSWKVEGGGASLKLSLTKERPPSWDFYRVSDSSFGMFGTTLASFKGRYAPSTSGIVASITTINLWLFIHIYNISSTGILATSTTIEYGYLYLYKEKNQQ